MSMFSVLLLWTARFTIIFCMCGSRRLFMIVRSGVWSGSCFWINNSSVGRHCTVILSPRTLHVHSIPFLIQLTQHSFISMNNISVTKINSSSRDSMSSCFSFDSQPLHVTKSGDDIFYCLDCCMRMSSPYLPCALYLYTKIRLLRAYFGYVREVPVIVYAVNLEQSCQ